MRMRHLLSVIGVFAAALAVTSPVSAQTKSTSRPAQADFRCDQGEPAPCGVPDRLVGVYPDDYSGLGTPEGGQGAHLHTGNELWIGLRNGLDAILDFTSLDQDGSCVSAGTCRFARAGLTPTISIPIGGATASGIYAEIQGDVVSGADTTPTMLSIAPGGTGKLRLFIGFTDNVMGLQWGLNFASNRYPDATEADVARLDACTWIISADGNARAGLSAYGSDYGRGKSYRTNEGLFVASFQITFRVPSLCS